MKEHPDYWEIPLQGLTVTRLVIDYSFSFDLDSGHSWVRVDSFLFTTAEESCYFDSTTQITVVGPALAIFGKQIVEARAYKNGDLDILFSDGSRIVTKADPHYEAWEVNGPDGMYFVSEPGGDLTIGFPRLPVESKEANLPYLISSGRARSLDDLLRMLQQAAPIDVTDGRLSPPMLLTSTVEQSHEWDQTKLESRLGVSLPQQMVELWNKASELRLYEDKNYGQWGIVIWTPAKVAESQEEIKQGVFDNFLPTDVVIGEFVGSSELIMLCCDAPLFDFGYVVIVRPMETRRQWPAVAASITHFLDELVKLSGAKYWERRMRHTTP